MENNFSKYILDNGGIIKKLELPIELSEGMGMCNPSIYIDTDKIICNIRKVNYLFHASESSYFNNCFGAVNYHHPDNDVNLRTDNYLCELTNELEIKVGSIKKVQYKDYIPKWSFIGEEDVRIVKWDNNLYLNGCRRDCDDKGTSRMELSLIDNNMNELNRERIPCIDNDDTYCEKNWMAINDLPYHFVRFINPLEIVKYNTETKTTQVVLKKEQNIEDETLFLRGSSQVIGVDNYYIAMIHETQMLYNRYNERNANYYMRFIVWDKEWNFVKLSKRFWFMNFKVEFSNGLAYDGKDFIIPFAVYDNAAFIARLNKNNLYKFIGLEYDKSIDSKKYNINNNNKLNRYIYNIYSPFESYDLGMEYFNKKQYASANAFFQRAAYNTIEDCIKYKDIAYNSYYMLLECLKRVGGREEKLYRGYNILINIDPKRYESYYELSKCFYGFGNTKNEHIIALGYVSTAIAMLNNENNSPKLIRGYNDTDELNDIIDNVMLQYAICSYRSNLDYESISIFRNLLNTSNNEIKKKIIDLGLNLY